MRAIQILEQDDLLLPTDWCRPLVLVTLRGGHDDEMSYRCLYSGLPENHVKWVQAKHVIGAIWHHRPLADYLAAGIARPYEFVRGELPDAHRLDMTGYMSLAALASPRTGSSRPAGASCL